MQGRIQYTGARSRHTRRAGLSWDHLLLKLPCPLTTEHSHYMMKLIMAVFFVQSRPLTLLLPVYHFAVGTSQACTYLQVVRGSVWWVLEVDLYADFYCQMAISGRWAGGDSSSCTFSYLLYMSVLYTSRMLGRRQGLENSLAGWEGVDAPSSVINRLSADNHLISLLKVKSPPSISRALMYLLFCVRPPSSDE